MDVFKQLHPAFSQKPRYRASFRDLFTSGGHAYRAAALRFLNEFAVYRNELAITHTDRVLPATWLVPFREDFRRVIRASDSSLIRTFLADCPPELDPLGVWLLGRSTGPFQIYDLKRFRNEKSPQVRRQVAKAFRRVKAWSLLAEMASDNPDDARIQWYANAPSARRPFVSRLKQYTSGVDDSHAGEVFTPSQMPFWSLERTWERTPPKSAALIRRLLRRIRLWVRWGVS